MWGGCLELDVHSLLDWLERGWMQEIFCHSLQEEIHGGVIKSFMTEFKAEDNFVFTNYCARNKDSELDIEY